MEHFKSEVCAWNAPVNDYGVRYHGGSDDMPITDKIAKKFIDGPVALIQNLLSQDRKLIKK